MRDMEPNLLMRAWMVAHLSMARYHAVVCCAGSAGEVAFREALYPQYTSERHDAKKLRTYYITGTCGGVTISRIASDRLWGEVNDSVPGLLHITVTSNTAAWEQGEISYSSRIVRMELDAERLTEIAPKFLTNCHNLESINLAPLHRIGVVPSWFLYNCRVMRCLDLSPLVNLREVGDYFLGGCSGLSSINLEPLRAIEVISSAFLFGCSGLQEVDLSPLVNVREVGFFFLMQCSGLTAVDLRPLRAIKIIPTSFLYGCSGLKELDLSPLTNVIHVSDLILQGCTSLTTIHIAPHHSANMLPTNLHALLPNACPGEVLTEATTVGSENPPGEKKRSGNGWGCGLM